MGALDRFLRRGRQQDGYKPMIKRLEAAMLAACRAAGASAWYVPDDFLTLGPELVSSGSFDSDAGWVFGGGFSVSAGKLVATAVATSSNAVINLGLVAGKTYLVTYDIDSISAGAITPIASSGAAMPQQTTSGSKVGVMAPLGNSGNLSFASSSGTALTAVIDNLSVREILSARDYQDSSGTLPTYFGGTVGLGLDATAIVGAELLTDPDLNDPTKWTAIAQPTSGSATISGGVISINSIDGTFAQVGTQFGGSQPIVAGKTYRVEFEVLSVTGGGVRVDVGGAIGAARTGAGTYVQYLVATNANQPAVCRASAVACSGTVSRVSVKEVSGATVACATAGNKPLISRIPRKLGPELLANGDFSGGLEGWIDASTAPSSISVAGGVARFNYTVGSTARLQKQLATQAGKSYQITGSPSANSVYLAVGTQSGGGQNMANAIAGASSVFTATSATTWVNYSSAIDGATVDNTSIREVLEWSYVLTFDGSNDSLAAPASVIGATLAQPYTMIQAFRAGQVGVGQRIQGDTGRWAAIGSTNKLVVTHQGSTFVAGVSDTALGELLISEVTWDGTTAKIWKNGVLDGQGALAAPSGVTPSAHNIGQNGGNASYFKGDLVYSCVCPAVMTDAQRLAVRKFAAAQMGMTL